PAAISEDVLSAAHVGNFAKVSPTLWRGAQPSDAALAKLAEGGIRTVIDLRMEGEGSDHEGQAASNLGLHYIHIPLGF
ncbi:fused DSP-PTPase phosphatase/NAD kinase-like protein, partial [Vibrio parahaemolyticus]